LTSTTLTVGILRLFPLDSLEVPLTALRRYLAQKSDAVDYLHPTKMEHLVGALFQDFYPGCQVVHCGRTNDGGIDLFVIMSDVPVAVQVKHRIRTDKGEGVKAIREFLGAMLVAGVSRGIFVTTADHFTGQAKEAINQSLIRGAITYFDLIDRHRLFDLLSLAVPKPSESWRSHV
jgi:HJR/Mrr/RecB family endonuclease